MAYKKIVVTGGACAGKTTGMARVREHLQNLGYCVVIVPEAATVVFNAAGRPIFNDKEAVMRSQKAILKLQMDNEKNLGELLEKAPKGVLLCDRGVHDSKAYISATEWNALLDDMGLNDYKLLNAYDAVVHLVTAADGAAHAYKLEGQRNETPEQARNQDKALQRAYLGHGHQKIIDNEGSFDDKMRRAVAEVCAVLGEPEPLEKERKFLVKKPERIGAEISSSRIEQVYLLSEGGEVRRVRKRTQGGASAYTLTSKVRIASGVNIEKEQAISGEEYVRRVTHERDCQRNIVEKTRHCFIHQKRVYELDEYHGKLQGLWVLEAEVEDMEAQVALPEWICVEKEVTNDPGFGNHNLALMGGVEIER